MIQAPAACIVKLFTVVINTITFEHINDFYSIKGGVELMVPKILAPRSSIKVPCSKGPSSKGLSSKGPSSKGPSSKGPNSKGPSSKGLSSKGLSSKGPSSKGPISKGLLSSCFVQKYLNAVEGS
jgi:hypothetical protein